MWTRIQQNDKDPINTANYLSFVVEITWAVSGRSESRLLSGTTTVLDRL
jgi:hypothetical protein